MIACTSFVVDNVLQNYRCNITVGFSVIISPLEDKMCANFHFLQDTDTGEEKIRTGKEAEQFLFNIELKILSSDFWLHIRDRLLCMYMRMYGLKRVKKCTAPQNNKVGAKLYRKTTLNFTAYHFIYFFRPKYIT